MNNQPPEAFSPRNQDGEAPSLGADVRRELSAIGLGMGIGIVALFVFNATMAEPALPPRTLLLYGLLSLLLAAVYVVGTRKTAHVTTPRLLVWLLTTFVIVLPIALLLQERAVPYFWLLILDGYNGIVFTSRKRHWGVAWIAGVLTLAWLSEAVLAGAVEASRVLLDDLVGYMVIIGFAEMFQRQMEQRTQIESLAGELVVANRELQKYTAQAEQWAVAQERARLAHEVHDTLGHTLTALDFQLELLVRLPVEQADERQQAAEQARSLLKEGLLDLQRAMKALRPAALEAFLLSESVRTLVANFERTTQLPVAVHVDGDERPLPVRYALPLFRAAQEALTNVQRHAPTTTGVTVLLCFAPHQVTLTVENAPPASAPAAGAEPETAGGYGLRGLHARAVTLGGAFAAAPDAAGGFSLEMQLPAGM